MRPDNADSTWWAEFATYHRPTLTIGEHHARGGVSIRSRQFLGAHDPADVTGAFAQLPDGWTMISEIREVDPHFHVVQVSPPQS